MLDAYKILILIIVLYSIIQAYHECWDKCYGWLGISMSLIVYGIFCLGM